MDLSKLSTPEGRAELVTIVRDAMHTNGFMYLINHGWSQTQVRQPGSLSHVPEQNTDVALAERADGRHRRCGFRPGPGRGEETARGEAHADRLLARV